MAKRGFAHFDARQAREEYLRRLDVRAVLDHYGVENDHEEANNDGTTEIIHSCLLDRVERHHANGDANPSAAANVERKLYVCYSYWGGSIFDLVQKLEDKDSFDGIVGILGEFLGEATRDAPTVAEDLRRLLDAARPVGTPSVPQGYSERILAPWAFTHPYLVERGVDHETASRLHIGWDEKTNRITIPHFWRGRLVGWQLRAIPDRPGQWPGTWGGGFPKYKSCPGFPKSDTLYTADGEGHLRRVREGTVVVVESPFSAIRAVSLGVDTPVLATFGAKISKRQQELLREFPRVVVWMDDDDAGRLAERKLARNLSSHTRVSVVTPDSGMDVGDYDSREAVEAKIASAVPAARKIMEWNMEVLRG